MKWLALAWAVSALLLASNAPAATRVDWTAPVACPTQSDVVRSVEAWLGEPLSQPRHQEIRVAAEVGDAVPYRVHLRIESDHGTEERVLEHENCQRLAEAAELVIALAIDPDRVKERQAAAPPSRPSTSLPQSAPLVHVEPAASPAPIRDREPSPVKPPEAWPGPWQLGVGTFLGGGALPKVTPGVHADLSLWRRAFGLALSADYWGSQAAVFVERPTTKVSLQLITAGLDACAQPLRRAVTLTVCLGGRLGDLHGIGQGVSDAEDQHARFSAVSAGLSGRYPALPARLAATLSAETGLSLERPGFGVVHNGSFEPVFRPEPWFWRAGLGLLLRL